MTSHYSTVHVHFVCLQTQMERANSQSEASASLLNHSGVWEEQRKLDAKQKMLEEQRQNFEAERKQVADAALTLAQEVGDEL